MTPAPVAAGRGMILMLIFASTAVMHWRINQRGFLMGIGAVINRSPDQISIELLPVGQWPILCL
jgi:hypothetical protein